MTRPLTFHEFFAGGGMARAGLGPAWRCLFANDFDPVKVSSYRANWGHEDICFGDIHDLSADDLPGIADLAWASFPCQDLSLAGNGGGLHADRSGAFWGFWHLLHEFKLRRRLPRALILENVTGLLTSHGGRDFAELCHAVEVLGYDFGALTVDAIHFLPQSRPRLFVIAVQKGGVLPGHVISPKPTIRWASAALRDAQEQLPPRLRNHWRWWALPEPPGARASLDDIVEHEPTGVVWHPPEETAKLLAMMSAPNRAKVDTARAGGRRMVGTLYRRTRADGDNGSKQQRAEVRFDGVAGCLRTPRGGSSRQTVLIVEGESVRSRLLSPREAARLMGLPDCYRLPERYNDAYHLAGDGVAVPVVRFLAEHLLEPLLSMSPVRVLEAAE